MRNNLGFYLIKVSPKTKTLYKNTVDVMTDMETEALLLLSSDSPPLAAATGNTPSRCCSSKWFGIIVVIILVTLNLTSSIAAYSLLQEDHVDPMILIYFNVTWDMVGFILASFFKSRASTTSTSTTATSTIELAATANRTKNAGLVMMLLFQLGNWLYFKGMSLTGISLTSIIYQSSTVFVFVFSLLFVKTKVTPYSIVSVLLCFGGVVIVALDNWDTRKSSETFGIICLLLSAMLWALYEVYLGVLFPKSTQYTVTMFVGWRGFWNLLLMWPFVLLVVTSKNSHAWSSFVNMSSSGIVGLCVMATISVLTTIFLTVGKSKILSFPHIY